MSDRPIVVVGSLNMDIVLSVPRMPATGETIQARSVLHVPGGKGANQAVGLARLGARSVMIGAVGEDGYGRAILERMRSFGVETDAIRTVRDVPTGTAHILLTPEDNSIIIAAGANARVLPEDPARHARLLAQAKVVLAQLEIPEQTVLEAFRLARAAGARTILNPAPARPLPDELLRLTDILTPNETELALLSGRGIGTEEELERVVRDWQDAYGHTVLVTRGSKGCAYLEEGRLRTVAPLKVPVVDTTGAGDAFNAAVAYGLFREWPLAETVRFAVKASSLSVRKLGAQDGMPVLEEVLNA
jgi:ribokinase